MPKIVRKAVETLSASEKDAMAGIITEAFDLLVPARQVLEQYYSTMPGVVLAYHADSVIAFQFFQEIRIDGVHVCRFSLAAKAEAWPSGGIQRAMGTRLVLRALRVSPFRRFAIVGISNNPRTYHNMLAVGGDVFPDVLSPDVPFAHEALYRRVADRLGIQGLDPKTGLIKNRADSVGVRMKPVPPNPSPIHRAFLDYVSGDPNQGVLTMVVTSAATSVPHYLMKRTGLLR